ncbi:hypothetical protein ScPMuIL_017911 [Solemya velum]
MGFSGNVAKTTGIMVYRLQCPQGWYKDGPGCVSCPGNETSPLNSEDIIQCTSVCVPGTYSDDGSGNAPCSLCPANYYNANSGSTSITDCVACSNDESTFKGTPYTYFCLGACAGGTFSIFGDGYVPCVACPEGTYGPDLMATSLNACRPCPAGTTSEEGSWSIYSCTVSVSTQCAPGTYSDTGEEPCTDCPANTYNPNAGSVNETDCLPCSAGEISPAGSTDISDCQDACAVKTCVGNEFCTNCLTGPCDVGAPDYAICTCPCEWGGSNCDIRLCEPGTWSLTGSPNCTDCPAGQYQDECGQTDCKLCPQGHTSHPGSSFLYDCFSCSSRFGRGWRGFDVQITPNCYFFCGKAHTYQKANQRCVRKGSGSKMVEINSLAENNVLFGVVASDRKNRWLGMHVDHDQTPPLPWWMSNPNQMAKWTNFLPGEPNNHEYHGETCVQMRKPTGKWNDVPCDKKLKCICEININ